jgi:hypothetical protein
MLPSVRPLPIVAHFYLILVAEVIPGSSIPVAEDALATGYAFILIAEFLSIHSLMINFAL